MKKKTNTMHPKDFEQFVKQFSGFISEFEAGIEGVMEVITGSFDTTKKDSAEITALFKNARSEAELIFSIFSGIAGIFSGSASGGGLFSALLGLVPGGGLLGAVLGAALPLSQSIYPQQFNNNPAPVVVVNTQLEKAGMYRVYREGKIISESRP